MKEILKNNILSVICAVVVIIALVVPFWPMSGYKDKLNSELNERVSVFKSLETIRTKPRTLPNVDTAESATPTPLDGFPNENVIAKGNEVKTAFETQSKQLVDEAITRNRKPLLVPGILPTPANNAVAIAFRDRYRSLILPPTPPPALAGGNPAAAGTAYMIGGLGKLWKVGVPPTQQDITNAVQTLFQRQYAPQLAGGGGNQAAKAQLQAEFDQNAARIPDAERNKVANNCSFYMNFDALPYITSFNNREAPPVIDLWNAQLNLWVLEDVGNGIAEANGKANVLTAPVKQLVKVTIPYPNPYIVQAGQTLEGELTGPAPKVLDLSVQGGAQSITPMTTGRISNPLYDVVQFDLVLNVDAASVPSVIRSLSKNRFLTVVSASMLAVDSFAMRQQGYMFGDKPVVQLTLRCEDLFFHKWEKELMPKVMTDIMTGVQPNMNGEGGPLNPVY